MSDGAIRSLGAREQAALARLVERTARGCSAASTAFEPTGDGARTGGAGDRADLIVSVGDDGFARRQGGWRERLGEVAGRAAKALLVVLANPERIGVRALFAGGNPDLLRALWEVGRVREHAYLVFPRAVEVLGAAGGQVAAPDLAYGPAGVALRRTAHLHAFLVDTAPRTPQARRRLGLTGSGASRG